MDAVYILNPYWFRPAQVYQPNYQSISGMPSEKELLERYTHMSGYDPRKDKWKVAQIFHLIRVSEYPTLKEVRLIKIGRNDQPRNSG